MAEQRGIDYGFQVVLQDGYWIVRVHDPDVPEEEYEIVADEDPDAALVSFENFLEQAREALTELRRLVDERQPAAVTPAIAPPDGVAPPPTERLTRERLEAPASRLH